MAKLCDPTAAVGQPGRLLELALGGPQTLRPRLTTGLPFSPAHQRCACRPTSLLIGYKFATNFEVVGIFFRHFSCAPSPFSSCSSASPRPTLLCCSIHRSAWNKNSANFAFWAFSEVDIPALCVAPSLCGRNSYVEITGAWPCLHKTVSGAGRWNRANFALTAFYEVRPKIELPGI